MTSLPVELWTVAHELLDALFPALCRLCAAPAPDGVGCEEHALPSRPRGPRCGRCAARLSDALPEGMPCAGCRRRPARFRSVVALGDYHEDAALRAWILALKHGGRRQLALPLGDALARRWLADGESAPPGRHALLVPVPAHALRRLERGYDQAWLLARAAAEASGRSALRALRRVRWTPPQGAPGARSRAANVRAAFRVRRGMGARLAGEDVWLVDDVLTSGATADACAGELRGAGAASVRVLCLARVEADPAPP